MTSSMEKLFFATILQDKPSYLNKILPYAFKNEQISFVYKMVRDYWLESRDKAVPSVKKIVELVRLEDPDKARVSDDILKSILTVDLSEYINSAQDDWLYKKLSAWATSTGLRDKIMESVDSLRTLDDVDYDQVMSAATKIKNMVDEAANARFDDMDLGSDFDDPETHVQDEYSVKIPTGWPTLDKLLNGGWDVKTLNILMGQTNVGKCVSPDTKIMIKIGDKVKMMTMEELYLTMTTKGEELQWV
jgi:hypothetical protein